MRAAGVPSQKRSRATTRAEMSYDARGVRRYAVKRRETVKAVPAGRSTWTGSECASGRVPPRWGIRARGTPGRKRLMVRSATAAANAIFTGPSGSRGTRPPTPRRPPQHSVADRGRGEELWKAADCGRNRPVVENGRVLRQKNAQ